MKQTEKQKNKLFAYLKKIKAKLSFLYVPQGIY